jgi:hypothetical protein
MDKSLFKDILLRQGNSMKQGYERWKDERVEGWKKTYLRLFYSERWEAASFSPKTEKWI